MNDFNLKDNKVIIVIICIIIIIFLCVFFYTRSNLENEYTELDNYNMLQNETNIEQEQEDISKIFIHVTGAVNNEGVVEIKEGSRIADAVDAANGFTEDADISQINLAYQLEDGQKIYIPRINDEKINGEEKVLQKEYVTDEAGDDIIIEDETSNIKRKENEKININTADQSSLEEIPGVGEATAQKIIEYRELNGKFKTIEDIKNVSGIGDSKFENMKEKINEQEIKKFNYYGNIFTVHLVITLLSAVPLFFWLERLAFIPFGILFVITMYWALKVEKVKKDNDIQTYKEIVAFSEGKRLDEIQKQREIGKRPYQNVLKMIVAAIVAIVVCFLIGLLFHLLGN